MANKMISEEELHDDFLSAVIHSDEPLKSPSGFTDEVMKRIGLLPVHQLVIPYKPPVWLKWGIPGFILASFLVFVLATPASEDATPMEGLSFFEKILDGIGDWFSGFNTGIQLPSLPISETFIWIMAGAIILTWSFVLLARFLERKL